MTLQPKHLLLLPLLLAITAAYALDGQWKLRTSEIPELKAARDIFFTFQQNLNRGSIVRQLSVSACNLLVYSYEAEEDQLFLRFSSTGQLIRRCIQGQLQFIRNVLDTIFYFYILDSVMLLLPPNGAPIKLDRIIDNTRPSINGVYAIRSAITFSPITQPTVIINGTHMSFCQDSTVFRYVISDKQTIRMGIARGGECNGFIGELMPNFTLYRVVESVNGRVVFLYDKQANLILSLGLKSNFSFTATISPDNFKESQSINKTNNSPEKQNNQSAASNKAGSNISSTPDSSRSQTNLSATPQTPITSTNSRNIGPSSIQSPQIINKSTNNQPTSFNNKAPLSSSSTPQVNNTNKIVTTNNTNKNTVKANTTNNNQIPTNPSVTINNSSINIANKTNNNQTVNYQLARTPNQLYGIWYPIKSGSSTSFSFSNYQLIINPARLLLSGPCNTAFSSYSFAGGAFTPQNVIRTQKVCPNSQDAAIQGIIFNDNNRFLISSGGTPRIKIQSEEQSSLLQLSQVAPV